MTEPSLALQTALRGRLVAFAALTALVPAASILDHTGPAAHFPSIILGDGQTVDPGTSIERTVHRVYLDLHIWAKADDLGSVKVIAGAARDALRNVAPFSTPDYYVVDLALTMTRFMRDKESDTPLAHGVMTFSALMQDIAS